MYESDRQLIQRMLAGEEAAFHVFFDTYAPRLASFVARRSSLPPATIEDIVQNTLIKALRNLRGFRLESAFFTWLCEICRRELIDQHRKVERRSEVEGMPGDELVPEETLLEIRDDARDPLSELVMSEHRSAVAKTLNGLPEHYSRALEWKYGDGFSVDEIANMLGVTTIAAQSLLARARSAFREGWTRQALT